MDIASLISGIFVDNGHDIYTKGKADALRTNFGSDCYAFNLDLSSLLGSTIKYLY